MPDHLVGEKVQVKVYSEKIVILYGKEKVASHQRSYSNGDWCIELEHYLRTLSRKPGALTHSVVWHKAPEELKKLYEAHFKNDNKAFVSLLAYAREKEFSGSDIIKACKELMKRGVRKISSPPGKGNAAWGLADRRRGRNADNPSFRPTGKHRAGSHGHA